MNVFKKKISKISIILVVVIAWIIDLSFGLWHKTERVIEWDVHSYYAYLPALVIFNDLQLKNMPDYEYSPGKWFFWPDKAPNGGNVIKTSMGLAFLYAPFFLIGHAIAVFFHFDSRGFSDPYKILLLISSLFYLAIGLIYIRKILKKFFSENVTTVTLLLLGLGTNLLCYASQSAPYSHVYNFALFAMFAYFTIQWYEVKRFTYALKLALLLGLISLIRPNNIIVIFFFIFYGVTGFKILYRRVVALVCDWKLILTFLICFILIWIPQIIYWKVVTGQFFYYSYGEERFYFNDPMLIDGIFGFRKGWLIYTPMMTFAIIGLLFFMRKIKEFQLPIIVFTALNLYIILSWWCWWYGGSFGQRSMVDSYALLAIPLAAFVNYFTLKKLYLKIMIGLFFTFFIWLNIFNTYQFQYGSLHYDGMTKELYFNQFGKLERTEQFYDLAKGADYEKAKKGIR